MYRDLIVSVVLPTRNPGAAVEGYVARVLTVLAQAFANYELIVVDDGSLDGSPERLRELVGAKPNLRLVRLSRAYGTEIAVVAGLDQAIGDFVAVLSPELSDPVGMLPQLVEAARDGVDVVYVRRPRLRPALGQGLVHWLAARLFYALCRRLTGLAIQDDASDFCLLSRRVVNSLTRLKEHNRVMSMLLAYTGFSTRGIDPDPAFGAAAYHWPGIRRRLHLALDAIVAFSDKPLRYVSYAAILISGVALVGAGAVLVERLLNAQVAEGWASLMVVQLVMFCLLFLLLAIISEYVSRILVEAKHRPLYYVREELGGTRLEIENIVDAR